jgi:hypothetical protein
LKQALAEAGTDAGSPDLNAIGLDDRAMARIVVQQLYGDDIGVEVVGGELRISIPSTRDLNPLALVAATGPFLRSADRFVVNQITGDGHRVIRGSAAKLPESWAEDETDRSIQMVCLMADCRVDGHPAAGPAEVRRALVGLAAPVLAKTELNLEDGRTLRKLIACAKDLRDARLEAALRKSMRRMSGQPIPDTVIQDMQSWAESPTQWRL